MKLTKYIIIALVLVTNCTTGNLIRSKSSEVCSRVSIPVEAIVNPNEVLESKGVKYAPARAYNAMLKHSIDLVECGKAQSCVIEWTEWERDCAVSRSILDRMLGFSCDIEKPSCRVKVDG